MRQKLTAIIPCKNERKNIRACIESVRAVADEVLIADSGSTDRTLEIVDQIGDCRVIEREYINSGDFKNWAIPQAAHPWVLIVDADERVSEALAKEIKQILSTDPPQDGYRIYRINHFMGRPIRYGSWAHDKVLRLFRRDVGRYNDEGDHARVVIPSGKVAYTKAKFLHYTFWTYRRYLEKLQRYGMQAAERRYEQGYQASFWRMFFRPPFRFLHLYLVRLGFMDGLAGLQVAAVTAFGTFLKEARLWELCRGGEEPDAEQAYTEISTEPTTTDRAA